jgi:hypothetical protein
MARGPAKQRAHLRGQPCSMAFLIRTMEDAEQQIGLRVDCAKAILPYQHRKLPLAVEGEINASGRIEVVIIAAD